MMKNSLIIFIIAASLEAAVPLPALAGDGDHPQSTNSGIDSHSSAILPEFDTSALSMPLAASSESASSRDAGPVMASPKRRVNGGDLPAAGVQWKSLMKSSLLYLGVMHSFRLATEAGTREGLHNSVVGGYFKALGSLHGWSDGDGYYENYLGHPIEGGVSSYIWIHNDPRYRNVQFGGERDYWMSRLRAYAFAWAFSEQFEIGPISEASIGQIQRYCCAYGFVDHIITPNGGMAWILVGDAVDRYVTVPLENRTHNVTLRILARVALNPPQSFANVMMLQYPWHRENRATASAYDGQLYLRPSPSLTGEITPGRGPNGFAVPKFELTASMPSWYQVGGVNCAGGEGIGAIRTSDFLQWTIQVGGCKFVHSLPQNWSGDSLTFMVGPQWIVHTAGRWSPHAHFRIGGQKITEEHVDPVLRKQVLANIPPGQSTNTYHDRYSKDFESTGLSLSVGGGLDIGLNRALAVRVANVDYTRSWLGSLNGSNFDHGFRLSTGLVLRIGTW